MTTLAMWFLFVPMTVLAAQWWLKTIRWLRRNQKTLGRRVERMKSAFAEDE